ncbi:MAG: Calx-beta domain-containing protein [Xenococcaceae cyanobacterium MO_188.B19]|nr:Calx-beta domain-containing protein [Xenococcaceae cyanobacterium MO_188.B19]
MDLDKGLNLELVQEKFATPLDIDGVVHSSPKGETSKNLLEKKLIDPFDDIDDLSNPEDVGVSGIPDDDPDKTSSRRPNTDPINGTNWRILTPRPPEPGMPDNNLRGFTTESLETLTENNATSPEILRVSITEDENDGDFSDDDLSLREAIHLANEDSLQKYTIILPSAETYFLTLGGTGDLLGDLDIENKNITIKSEGSDKAIIDASTLSVRDRVFDIHEGANVTFDNLKITGGFVGDDWGGGIQVEDASLEIKNSIIEKNTGDIGGGISFRGYTDQVFLKISNSEFLTNTALSYGGGAHISVGTYKIEKTKFVENEALDGDGGGLSISAPQGEISESSIKSNSAKTNGGGISSRGEQLIIRDTSIEANNSDADGGAVSQTTAGSVLKIENTSITDNLADNGGGLYLKSGTTYVTDNKIHDNSTREGGTGFRKGGGAYIDNDAIFERSDITNSQSIGAGGGIYLEGKLTFLNGKIDGNKTIRDSGGGVFASRHSKLEIIDSIVTNNTASLTGGGINLDSTDSGSSKAILEGSLVAFNIAPTGGGIFIDGGDSVDKFKSSASELKVYDSTLAGNRAIKGGAIANEGKLIIIGSTLSYNSALVDGGAIIAASGSDTILPCLGGIGSCDINKAEASTTIIFNTSFGFNTADADGDDNGTGNAIYTPSNAQGNPDLGISVVLGQINLYNSIIDSGGDEKDDIAGTIFARNTLIRKVSDENRVMGVDNILNEDARLDPNLDFNGGLTPNHNLLSDSPAIGAGNIDLLPPDTRDIDDDGDLEERLPLDQNRNERVSDNSLDLGSVQFQEQTTPEDPTISVNDFTVVEGLDNQGVFTVSLSDASTQPITVEYITVDDTATAEADYQTIQGTLTFAPGETTKTVAVDILDDDLNEANETFKLVLSNPSNATLADGEGVATISDTLFSARNTNLPTGVENLSLRGSKDRKGRGNSNNNIILGNRGDNLLLGGDGDDTINGRAGNDTINGGQGDDLLIGSHDDDLLRGQAGRDKLLGGDGNDYLYGGLERDTLSGGEGNDWLFGNQDRDILQGNDDDDTLQGGEGNDILIGGDGMDVFVLEVNQGRDTIRDYVDGIDKFGLSNSLTYDDLNIKNNFDRTATIIRDNLNQAIAVVRGIEASMVTEQDFMEV